MKLSKEDKFYGFLALLFCIPALLNYCRIMAHPELWDTGLMNDGRAASVAMILVVLTAIWVLWECDKANRKHEARQAETDRPERKRR